MRIDDLEYLEENHPEILKRIEKSHMTLDLRESVAICAKALREGKTVEFKHSPDHIGMCWIEVKD